MAWQTSPGDLPPIRATPAAAITDGGVKVTPVQPLWRGALKADWRRFAVAASLALVAALDMLNRGGIVGVYPEGTRSRDGVLHRGNLGPARLAVAADVPA